MKEKNILIKFVLSSIFSFALLFGLYNFFGASVYAKDVYLSNSSGGENTYTSLNSAIQELNRSGGGNIIVKTDFELKAEENDGERPIATNITIKSEQEGESNRKKITRVSGNNGYFIKEIKENTTLTLENIEINGGGNSAYNSLIAVGENVGAADESTHKPAKLVINEGTKITNANLCIWGAIDLLKGSSLEMKGGEISNIKAANGSAAIYTRGNNDIKLSGNAKITNNQMVSKEELGNPQDWWQSIDSCQGGAIFVNQGSTLDISDNVDISNNKTLKDGGAIRAFNATINMTGGVIKNNIAEGQGGGIELANATMTINGGQVLNNVSKSDGGAFAVIDSSNLTIANSNLIEISKNTCDRNGGAIFAWNASITINGGKFENNGKNITEDTNDGNIKTAEAKCLKGGAIFIGNIKDDEDKDFIINGGTISNNKSSDSGGGIYLEKAKLTINEATISENSTGNEGGGIYLGESIFSIKGGTISENLVNNSGAGISASSSTISIEGGTIEKNIAKEGQGGGINLWNTTIVINKGKILRNTCKTNGGGIVLSGPHDSNNSLSIGQSEEIEISKNTCTGNGGGIFLWDSEATINGGKIDNNGKNITINTSDEEIKNANAQCNMGGGIFIGNNGETAKNITINGGIISNNSCTNAGGGIFSSGAKLTIKGGTISGNTSVSGGGIYFGNGLSEKGNIITGEINLGSADKIETGCCISNNTAIKYGGGIVISDDCFYNMYSGKIEGNVAKINGGGLLFQGTSTGNFVRGSIINNKCEIDINSYDFDPEGGTIGEYSGGGMYIGEDSTVIMNKVIVKQNSNDPSKAFSKYIEDKKYPKREKDKDYSGNGITCCPSSKLHIYKENGCAIYDNINTENNDQSKQFDVFQGRKSEKHTPEFYNTNIALGGGYYGWTDYNGNPILTGTFKGDKLSVLKSNLNETDKEKAEELALVKIENNHSTSLWGAGGITCNGILKIGEPAEERKDDGDTTIKVEKQATKNAVAMAESEEKNGKELRKFDFQITLKGEGIDSICKNVYINDCNNEEGILKPRTINDITWKKTAENVYTSIISLYASEKSSEGWYFYLLNIPDGTEYKIEEIIKNSDNYITNVEDVFNNKTIEGRIIEGKVAIEEEKITENAEFSIPTAASIKYNNDYESSDLIVNKKVVGASENSKAEKFNFTITLNNKYINGTYGEMEFNKGIAKISIGDGESKTAKELPIGVEYEVEEEKNSKYNASYDNNSGSILSDKESTVNYTNTLREERRRFKSIKRGNRNRGR